MSQLMLINPKKRRKGRTAAQKAATRRMLAANRRHKNPIRRRRATAAAPVHHRRRRNPISLRRRVHHRRRHRNPIGGSLIHNTLKPAFIAAAGAVGVDVIWGMLPIPANLSTGPAKYAAKAVGAVAVGMLIGKVLKQRALGHQVTMGSLTVVLHSALADSVAKYAPALHMGAYDSVALPVGEYLSSMQSDNFRDFNSGDMGEYLNGDLEYQEQSAF